MKFSDVTRPELILVNMESTTQQDVFCKFAHAVVRAGVIETEDEDLFLQMIVKREQLGSTGVGGGVAVPHLKWPVDDPTLVIGTSRKGIPWSALDDKPVYLVFLILSRLLDPADHHKMLYGVSRHIRNDNFCNWLRQAETVEDVLELLKEADDPDFWE